MMKPATSLLLAILLILPFGEVSAMSFSVSEVENLSLATLSSRVLAESGEVFCSGWGEMKTQLEVTLQKKDDRVVDYLGGLVENLDDRRGVRDAKREGIRSEVDQLRSAGYAKLESIASTEREKEAVKKYQERVEKSLEDRRSAIDTAVLEYRSSVDELVNKRRTVIESARKAFHSSVEVALKTVDTDCSTQASSTVIFKNFKNALAQAEAKLSAAKKQVTAMEGQVRTLAEMRKKSITNVIQNFQAELKEARAELQKALGS